MPTTPLPESPVRSADELTQRWATLLAPPVFAVRSLWLTWFDTAGLMTPVVIPIDDLPLLPDHVVPSGVLRLNDTVVDSTSCADGHLALALCRPGTPLITTEDDEWAEELRLHLDAQLGGTWSLHVAAGGAITEVVAPPSWTWRRPPG
jgi:hypothetical protein